MKKFTDEEVSKWNKAAQEHRVCYESNCEYFYAEINECMVGEDGVPDNLEMKCKKEK